MDALLSEEPFAFSIAQCAWSRYTRYSRRVASISRELKVPHSSRIVVACRSIHSLLRLLALLSSLQQNGYHRFASLARRLHQRKTGTHRMPVFSFLWRSHRIEPARAPQSSKVPRNSELYFRKRETLMRESGTKHCSAVPRRNLAEQSNF